jgi:hypothetical protein
LTCLSCHRPSTGLQCEACRGGEREPERTAHAGPLRLTINGAPRTKKNHGRRVWSHRQQRAVHVPSEAYEAWVANALPQLIDTPRLPDAPYNCRALFYRDRRTGDAVGYYQGLADLLEAAGVVSDDRWIESWDGSRLLWDRERPRVEIELTAAEGAQARAA